MEALTVGFINESHSDVPIQYRSHYSLSYSIM